MSEYPRDEFDDVPEDGARQGAHRGHNPNARAGSRGKLLAILVTGVLALVLGAVAFVNAPRTAQEALALPAAAVAVSPDDDAAAGASGVGASVAGASAVGAVALRTAASDVVPGVPAAA
ncbi:hypothetical protein MHK71_05380 [Kocuria indica]|uniref:hypothetical protein n=1 Tax=Kocuria marina TaxID=223184 RepID=UPI001EF5D26E|nr:hypothetical protein [Kocuria indica]MCG7431943.1 hypothetical protein [Kocuria indica]